MVREYRLPGIRGVGLPGILEGFASVFGASRGSSHISYSFGSFCIYRLPSVASNTFHGYVGACGSVQGGRPVFCDERGRSYGVGACRVVRFGRFRGQSDVVVSGGRRRLRRSACRGSVIVGRVRSDRSHRSTGLRATRLLLSVEGYHPSSSYAMAMSNMPRYSSNTSFIASSSLVVLRSVCFCWKSVRSRSLSANSAMSFVFLLGASAGACADHFRVIHFLAVIAG